MRTRTVFLVVLGLGLALAPTGWGCAEEASTGTTEPGYVTLSVEEAFEQLGLSSVMVQIVDIRQPDEWAETGVPLGAVLIPLAELEARAPLELAKDRPVFVICNSGNRSRTGAQILIDLGFPQVFNVDGGIQAWLAAGYPVEAY